MILPPPTLPGLLLCCAILGLVVSCANFRKLGRDLALIDQQHRIVGSIANADDQGHPVRVIVVEWDREHDRVYGGDVLTLAPGGAFVFLVSNPRNQFVAAFVDADGDGRHSPGETWWMHGDTSGEPLPVVFEPGARSVRIEGRFNDSSDTPPVRLREAIDLHLNGRTVADSITRQGVDFSLGEVVDLDDSRFSVARGEDGLWAPASSAIEHGFGVYFLQPYDPHKIPVLFIHGAGGTPQSWGPAVEALDRTRYQPWVFVYPSGLRLDTCAAALDEGILYLHQRYRFERMHVAAHSMGGLVARRFILDHLKRGEHAGIATLITFATPWSGHEAAAIGVRRAPHVVPSWRDMVDGAPFLDALYADQLKGRVDHHILYSHRASRSVILPSENDGAVSVASQLRPEAVADAVSVTGFDERHVSIISAPGPLRAAGGFLDAADDRP